MSAEKVIASYLRVAAEDLRGARLLAQDGNRNTTYLCSQAAESELYSLLADKYSSDGILRPVQVCRTLNGL